MFDCVERFGDAGDADTCVGICAVRWNFERLMFLGDSERRDKHLGSDG